MAKKVFRKIADQRDPGFGVKIDNQGDRFVNRDGSFNIEKKGASFWQRFNFYHAMITMTWGHFILVILGAYLLINICFAGLYMIIGFENLAGTVAISPMEKFFEAFFFSAQTFTTVGYGRVNPVGLLANFLVVFELLLGLLSLAIATGLFYARSSRPVGKIIFSDQAIISPYRTFTGLMFRIANAQNNQLIEVEVQFMLSWIETENGASVRKFYELALERNKVSFLWASWTVVHPIDEKSPLFGFTEADMAETDAEFMIIIKGFDDTYFQNVYVRTSYKFYEIMWGAKFISTYGRSEKGSTVVDLSTLGRYEKVDLPGFSFVESKDVLLNSEKES
ncbi:MAG: ion channel [Bacteroidota bacterium]